MVSESPSTETIIEVDSSPEASQFSYSVKIINPSKKTAYSMRKLRLSCRFETPQELKDQLCDAFSDQIGDTDELEFGYISPGHGARGK